jgi:hypothetical protein
VRVGALAVGEQGQGNYEGTDEEWREAVFWPMGAVETRHPSNMLFGQVTEGELTDGQPNGETEVGETTSPGGELVAVLVDEAECCKDEEEVALGDGGIDSKQQDDGRMDQQSGRTDPGAFKSGDESGR